MPWGFFLVLILYLAAVFFYLMRLILGYPALSAVALRIMILAAVSQSGVLAYHAFTDGGAILGTYLGYFQASALILAALFIVLCFGKKFYAAGPIFAAAITVLTSLSLTYSHPGSRLTEGPGRGYLVLHISSIFLALSAFAVGFISAGLFLVEEGHIKAKAWRGWVTRLPSLAALDDVHYKALYAGFLLFSFAILTGGGYAKMTTGHYLSTRPIQVLSVLLWVFLAAVLNLRVRQGLQGHKGVVLSCAGFAGLALLYFVGLA